MMTFLYILVAVLLFYLILTLFLTYLVSKFLAILCGSNRTGDTLSM